MAWPRGVRKSQEIRAKISVGLRLREPGDPTRYITTHQRHQRTLPPGCFNCGDDGATDAALRHDTPPERIRTDPDGPQAGLAYSLDTADYARLCHRCHAAYDGRGSSVFGLQIEAAIRSGERPPAPAPPPRLFDEAAA